MATRMSTKCLAIQSILGRLVETTKHRVLELIERFSAESLITPSHKNLLLECSDSDKKTRLLFYGVIDLVQCRESLFERLVSVLRDMGFDDLAGELQMASLRHVPPSLPRCLQPLDRVEADSGFVSRNQTGWQANLTNSTEHIHVQALIHDQLLSLERRQRFSNNSQVAARNDSEQEEPPAHSEAVSDQNNIDVHSSFHLTPGEPDVLLQPQLQVQEPRSYDDDGDGEEQQHHPIQADSNGLPSDVIVLPDGDRFISEGASNSTTIDDSLVESLTDRIHHMRQELRQKEAEGMQVQAEKLELEENCKELEEKVKRISGELKQQKKDTERVKKEKDDEIRDWRKRYKEKEDEVQNLVQEIAQMEREKEEMTKKHESQINELHAQHQKAEDENRSMEAKYQTRINSLEKDLEEANQKKEKAEIDLAYAREYIANLKLQREQDLSKMKDKTHALELQVRDLKEEVWKKEVQLYKKDKELAEERQVNSENRLQSHRRESREIQQNLEHQIASRNAEVEKLQKELQRLRSQTSSSSNNSLD